MPATQRPLTVIRRARLVEIGGVAGPPETVDVMLSDGHVTEIAPRVSRPEGAEELDADGRWLMPGLWDAHTHPVMWGLARRRIDLAGTAGPQEVCRRVADHLAGHPGAGLVVGYGYRSAAWAEQPRVAELDAVSGGRPVALASGDGHNGWLNTAALQLIGETAREGAFAEEEWFAAYRRIEAITAETEDPEEGLRVALDEAAAKGVVGIVDFEFGSAWRAWPERISSGNPPLRVRAATYADGLEGVAAAGLRTGDRLVPECDLVTMGPLKVISDGSLGTLTAWCHQPYGPAHRHGSANLDLAGLTALMTRAREIGLEAAIHAIGDAAFAQTLDAFEGAGQRGRVEHAQLVELGELPHMAALGLTASVQPWHLIDDRDATDQLWGDRSERVFAFRALADAGIPLVLGSDAPVAPLDPWAAMAAAVHRSGDARGPWHPEQSLTVAEALAASTDGRTTTAPGMPADLVLVDRNPHEAAGMPGPEAAAYLRAVGVEATFVAGLRTH
ncbi:amidohydrolase [Nostocoides australiense]